MGQLCSLICEHDEAVEKIIDLVVVYDTSIGVYNTFLCDAQFR